MNTLQELPQDVGAEQAVISLILTTPERFVEVVDIIKPSDFYRTTHQAIWQALTTLFRDGQELDVVSIKNQIKRQESDTGPIFEALSDCYTSNVYSSNLHHFISIVTEKSMLRQILRVTQSSFHSTMLDNADPQAIMLQLEKDLIEINERTDSAKAIDAFGIISELSADISKTADSGWRGHDTGFVKLDTLTGGFIPTQSWIVGAYTGVGKTWLLLQMILNVLRQGGKVVLFSTEMDRKMNMLRLIGNIAGLGTINMMRSALLENEQEEMEKAKDELKQYKDQFTIYDNVYTLAEIRLKAKKLKLTKGLDIIVVDFIQNLRGSESIYERMAEAAVGLQQLAQELDVTMVIGSQVSQSAASWSSKEAIEFKGAGEIAAIADVAIWLNKDRNGDPNMRQVVIRKVRHGAPGKFNVKMDFPAGRVLDIDKAGDMDSSGDDDVKSQL